MKKYNTTDVRSPESQNDYADWEKKVILAVHGKDVTAEQLTNILPRTKASITIKACSMGCSLKTTRKNSKAKANNKIFNIIESFGLSTAAELIKNSGLPESAVRSSLMYLVDSKLIKCRTHKKRGYVYYIFDGC